MFSAIRGSSLDEVRQNIKHFSEETGLPIQICAVISALTLDTMSDLPEFVSQFPSCNRLFFQMVNGVPLLRTKGLDVEGGGEALREAVRKTEDACNRHQLATNLRFSKEGSYAFDVADHDICKFAMTGLAVINHRGFFVPCCIYMDKELDSVKDLGFRRAWNGPEIRRWRAKMLKLEYPHFCQQGCG